MRMSTIFSVYRRMVDYGTLIQPDQGQDAHDIEILKRDQFDDWLSAQPEASRVLVAAQRFCAKPGESIVLPGEGAAEWRFVLGAGLHGGFWDLATAAAKLPSGTYRLAKPSDDLDLLGWLLAHYRFGPYLTKPDPIEERVLLTSAIAQIRETVCVAEAVSLVRDLVNTPAADMGPAALQHHTESLAKAHSARVAVTSGHALETGFPMIHAVGRAAEKLHAPRLIELEWGHPDHPRVAIIGKGITFDSGGLDIKPGAAMKIMKKDMGGAAHALGLAKIVMENRLPVRLHLLIPAAENAISGNAFRPGDILRSRNGLTVEIDNTDAEGRLVLADAITRAAESSPELIVDFATLTGAARVALGPDLPALFCNDHALADAISKASVAAHDPVWRLPLWSAYEETLKSEVADTLNSGEGGMAGAITAALFLRKFVPKDVAWVHLDTWAWRTASRPGRPKGGEALGMRAVWATLKARYSLSGS
jgi:leucyl aminopeptidase